MCEEEKIRDMVEDYVEDELDKINKIRLELLDGDDYINATNDYWVIETIDDLVDDVIDYGVPIDDDLLSGVRNDFIEKFEYSEDKKLKNLQGLFEGRKYDEVLKKLREE